MLYFPRSDEVDIVPDFKTDVWISSQYKIIFIGKTSKTLRKNISHGI